MTWPAPSPRWIGSSSSTGAPVASCSKRGSPPGGWPATTWSSTRSWLTTARQASSRSACAPGRQPSSRCLRIVTVSAQPQQPETAPGLPSDILEVEDRYYILATSSLADEQDRVLKEGETFVVFDRYGDIKPVGLGEEGLYHEGTRFLSGMLLRLAHERPMLLSSTIRQDNALLAVDLTNPDVSEHGELIVPRGTLHISRT